MTNLHELQFYATPEHVCSYLPDRQARTLFVDPKAQLIAQDYAALSELGFRRSGEHVYRPHCTNCSACISVRIPVDRFRFTRNQKRVLKINSDLTCQPEKATFTQEHYELYERYICARHPDGDMYPPSEEQYRSFLTSSRFDTRFYAYRHQHQLVAVSVIDPLPNGLSAIYTFFDPDLPRRSLGRYAILQAILHTRSEGGEHLYLGYWVRGCQKMDYKILYTPIQILHKGRWIDAIK